MSYLPRVLIVVMGLLSTFSYAGSSEKDESVVTMELLEFLSEWETDHGEWIGPDGFIDDSFDQFYEIELEDSEDENQD